jgi:hypothetical protein
MEPCDWLFIDARAADRAAGGAAMSTELDRIELGRFAGFGGFSDRSEQATAWYFAPHLRWLAMLLIAGLGAGLLWYSHDTGSAESEPIQPVTAAVGVGGPASPGMALVPPAAVLEDKLATATDVSPLIADPSPVSGLSISSQSWRRGGLGSKALVTFTLRNSNDYAVKDIELLCAFARRDGSHLTERKRVILETVDMKSRKIFAHMLVGFVNVNASRAKCVAVAANRV